MNQAVRRIFILIFFLTACVTAPAATLQPTSLPTSLPTNTKVQITASSTPSITPPPSQTPTNTPVPTSTPTPGPLLCSPLEDISLAELPEILTNPFDEPLPGWDNGHHGADFAYYSRGTHKVMQGLPIKSILAGRVAAIIVNKPPYGNAIIIETSLENLQDAGILPSSILPTPAPTIIPDSRLTCPTLEPPPVWPAEKSSLYLLYAHMESAPTLQIGETINCGQQIGQVGTTGKSVNPHLHLESRLGPPQVTFSSMGHYGAVSQTEMANYCLWRASQWFQMFDPMRLFQ